MAILLHKCHGLGPVDGDNLYFLFLSKFYVRTKVIDTEVGEPRPQPFSFIL